MKLIGSVDSYQTLTAEALAVPVFTDEMADSGILQELDAATGGVVGSVLSSGEMKGKEGSCSAEKAAEGKCSAEMKDKAAATTDKAAEGSCSAEMKGKEGSCHADKK